MKNTYWRYTKRNVIRAKNSADLSACHPPQLFYFHNGGRDARANNISLLVHGQLAKWPV